MKVYIKEETQGVFLGYRVFKEPLDENLFNKELSDAHIYETYELILKFMRHYNKESYDFFIEKIKKKNIPENKLIKSPHAITEKEINYIINTLNKIGIRYIYVFGDKCEFDAEGLDYGDYCYKTYLSNKFFKSIKNRRFKKTYARIVVYNKNQSKLFFELEKKRR
jgi:hypothetical protein